MGPVDAALQAVQAEKDQAFEKLQEEYCRVQEDYGKLVEAPELADVVLVVEGERFPAHRVVLAVRSEYFRGLLLSGMQEGSGQQEIALGEVSAGAFRVVLRYLYTAVMPAWEELQGAGREARGGGAAGGGHGGSGNGGVGVVGGGGGKEAAGSEEDEGAGCAALELGVLKAADLFQALGRLKHCLEGFRGGLTVHIVLEQLVWAHKRGPAEARAIATEYFVAHVRAVRVRV
jgi:hypothetical protein